MRQLTERELQLCKQRCYYHEADYIMAKFRERHGDGWEIVDFRPPRLGEYAIGASDNVPPFEWDQAGRLTPEARFILCQRKALGRWNPLKEKR